MNPRNWEAIEARFQCAKLALLEAQEDHCEAAQEFLQARAALRQMLEAFFPEPFGCNRAAETLAQCSSCTAGESTYWGQKAPLTAD